MRGSAAQRRLPSTVDRTGFAIAAHTADENRATGLRIGGADRLFIPRRSGSRHEQNADESFAFWNYGPELSRRFRALKIWLTLRYYGTRRIAGAISEDNALCQYLGQEIEQADDFEILAPPELSICCFRYVPPAFQSKVKAKSLDEADNEELDQLNSKIMLAVQRGGRAYLSSATLRGKFALRAWPDFSYDSRRYRTRRWKIDLNAAGIFRLIKSSEVTRKPTNTRCRLRWNSRVKRAQLSSIYIKARSIFNRRPERMIENPLPRRTHWQMSRPVPASGPRVPDDGVISGRVYGHSPDSTSHESG